MTRRGDFLRAAHRGPLRWPVALAASVLVTRRNGQPCVVTPLGDWYAHRYRDGTFVFPDLRGTSASFFRWQAYDSFFWQYVPRPGDVVVDVGAGIGEETLSASKLVGPTGRVISIEAQPTTFERLKLVCRLNRLRNVTTLHLAVTDRSGTVRIQDNVDYVASSIIEEGGVEVQAGTLDQILGGLGVEKVDLLKVNIEGAERQAVRGMTKTLAATAHLVISCHDFLGPDTATFDEVYQFVEEQGFDVVSRPDAELPWNRFNVYGSKEWPSVER